MRDGYCFIQQRARPPSPLPSSFRRPCAPPRPPCHEPLHTQQQCAKAKQCRLPAMVQAARVAWQEEFWCRVGAARATELHAFYAMPSLFAQQRAESFMLLLRRLCLSPACPRAAARRPRLFLCAHPDALHTESNARSAFYAVVVRPLPSLLC